MDVMLLQGCPHDSPLHLCCASFVLSFCHSSTICAVGSITIPIAIYPNRRFEVLYECRCDHLTVETLPSDGLDSCVKVCILVAEPLQVHRSL